MTEQTVKPIQFIDTKLPLPWLISSAVAVVVAMGGVFVKLDALSQAVVKLEAKTDRRDDAVQLIIGNLGDIKGNQSLQASNSLRNEKDIDLLKRDIEDLKKNQRWMPK